MEKDVGLQIQPYWHQGRRWRKTKAFKSSPVGIENGDGERRRPSNPAAAPVHEIEHGTAGDQIIERKIICKEDNLKAKTRSHLRLIASLATAHSFCT